MDVKAYLRQIKTIDHRIQRNLAELQKIESSLTKVTPTLRFDDGVCGSSSADKMDYGVAKIIELKTEIKAEIEELVDFKRDVLRILSKLSKVEYQDVLYKRYFKYEKWEHIAVEMNMTYRNVCYVHGKALKDFESIIQEEIKTDE